MSLGIMDNSAKILHYNPTIGYYFKLPNMSLIFKIKIMMTNDDMMVMENN